MGFNIIKAVAVIRKFHKGYAIAISHLLKQASHIIKRKLC